MVVQPTLYEEGARGDIFAGGEMARLGVKRCWGLRAGGHGNVGQYVGVVGIMMKTRGYSTGWV